MIKKTGKFIFIAAITAICSGLLSCSTDSKKGQLPQDSSYYFDGSISRESLESYLDRAVTAGYFLVPGTPERYEFPYREDDVRMLQNIGAKFIGRAIYRWSEESKLNDPEFLEYAKKRIERMHEYDPEIVFQGCLFEHISADANNLKIPAWVFEAFGLPVEERTFKVADMIKRINPDDPTLMPSNGGGCPMINNLETRLYYYFLAKSYIDIGCEAFHLGQVGLIGKDDPDKTYYAEFLQKIRDYAKTNARRHYIILDAHARDFIKDGVSLIDFFSCPLRIKEVLDKPMEGMLDMEHINYLFGKSPAAISPSGWKAEHMPYLAEFDNFGVRREPPVGVAVVNDIFCWGYDDISWFAIQSEDYRNKWLWYAFDWIHENDPNGHLQMCVTRMISGPEATKTLRTYFANTRSEACPIGYSQEETIKEIWNTRLTH